MNRNDLNPGDFVEHHSAPGTIWETRAVDPWTPDGGRASLRWIGGKSITYEDRQRIFNVFEGNSDVVRIRDLKPANPMLVLALVAK